jgi:hypothetical protein
VDQILRAVTGGGVIHCVEKMVEDRPLKAERPFVEGDERHPEMPRYHILQAQVPPEKVKIAEAMAKLINLGEEQTLI